MTMTTTDRERLLKLADRVDLSCSYDVLNPCYDNRPGDVAGLHWDGFTPACGGCALRADINQLTPDAPAFDLIDYGMLFEAATERASRFADDNDWDTHSDWETLAAKVRTLSDAHLATLRK